MAETNTTASTLGGTNPAGKESGYAGYAAAVQAVTTVAKGFAETSAFKAKLEATLKADLRNASSTVDSYELQQTKSAENIIAINSAVGDKLSERGLTAMKEAALLKVAKVETGGSGGTSDMGVEEAFINANMDRAVITKMGKDQIKAVLTSMEISTETTRNKIDTMLLGGGVSINTNAALAGIAGGLGTGLATLALLPQSDKTLAFGITPDEVV